MLMPRSAVASGPLLKRKAVSPTGTTYMSTRFQVTSTFNLAARKLFTVYGEVIEGAVSAGQAVVEPTGLDALVYSIEFIHFSTERRVAPGAVAITFRYADDQELARWAALPLTGATISLTGDYGAVCPFRVGDSAVYTPTDRGRSLLLHTSHASLVAGQSYRIARIDRGVYLVLEGFESDPGGGLHWGEFTTVR